MNEGIGIVQTAYGKVSGVPLDGKLAGITTFLGIPYAAPPVGNLRWRPPVDPTRWDGIRACNAYGRAAMQKYTTFEPNYSDFYYRGHPEMSEDCLYLNVTTGAVDPGEKRPVYIWFHGGGLFNGYSYIYIFDPAELARKGVVVVSVGHRLNLFGYMALPQLSAEQGGKSGNYGLMDEFKALDWVHENIAAFGGDPDNITVGGQSGGSAKSGVLASSPHTEGRVKRVINQSALYWRRTYPTVEEIEQSSRDYLKSIGIDPDASTEKLREIDATAYLGAEDDIGRFRTEMVHDGDYVLHREQTRNYEAFGTKLDYLIGTNYGEGSLRGRGLISEPFENVDDFHSYMKTFLGELYDRYAFEKIFTVTEENLDRRARLLTSYGMTGMGGLMVDRYFGAYREAAGHAGRTYAYRFERIPPWRPEDVGTDRDPDRLLSYHSSEMWYTFGSLAEGVPPVRPWQPLDYELADKMTGYWANFMRSGNPNGSGLPVWPECDESYGWIRLGDTVEGHTGLDGEPEKMILEYLLLNGRVPRI